MKENTEEYRKGLGKKESLLLSELAREDKPIFTARDVRSILRQNPYLILHSLKRKRWILTLKPGLYAIVPLDIGVKGAESFIVHDFVVASRLVKPYYIAFWTALNYHGLSDQIPASVFICTPKPKKSLNILYSRFVFVQVSKRRFFGIETIEMEGTKVDISDKNKTVVDCLDHPEHSGGTEEIAKSIYFYHEELNFEKIRGYALKTGNIAIFKRLGYTLECVGLFKRYGKIFDGVKLTEGYSPLDRIGPKKGTYNERWKLLVNIEINPERWKY